MGILDKIFDNDDRDKKNEKEKKDADAQRNVSFGDVMGGAARGAAPAAAPATPSAPRADFSDVRSGSSTTAPTATPQTVTVAAGDSLSKIAKRVYGDAGQWKKIYEANRELIGKNPDLIHPGQVLTIPQG